MIVKLGIQIFLKRINYLEISVSRHLSSLGKLLCESSLPGTEVTKNSIILKVENLEFQMMFHYIFYYFLLHVLWSSIVAPELELMKWQEEKNLSGI